MADTFSIKFKKIAVHILDNNISLPVLSDYELPLDGDILGFLESHIVKILNDDGIKHANFTDESSIRALFEKVIENSDEFLSSSIQIADSLFDIMQKNPDIPPCDLVCVLMDIDGVPGIGILKMNYRASYIHHVGGGGDGKLVSVIKQVTALPNESQKVDECAIINLNDLSLKVIDKKYEINGEKIFYFSDMLLKCSCSMSDREKVQLFKKATKSFAKKYLDDDITKTADIKNAVAESIEQNDAIIVENVAEKAFRRNPGLRDTYIEHMESAGLDVKEIDIKPELTEKVFKRHKIKTDTGIEINVPVDFYKNKDMLEFISGEDGTISILIKNISKITDI